MVAISKTYKEKDFQSLLLELHDFKNRQFDLAYYNNLFKSAILSFGSSTPDNRACVERIGLGNSNEEFGIKISHRNLLFKKIIADLQKSKAVFNTVLLTLPDLTKQDWQSILSFAELLLEDLENPFGLTYRMKEVFNNGEEGRLEKNVLQKINAQTQFILKNQKLNHPTISIQKIIENLSFSIDKNQESNTLRYGIRLNNYIFLSDLFSILEETPKPNFLKSQQDWEAFNRLMVLIFLAFEGNEILY